VKITRATWAKMPPELQALFDEVPDEVMEAFAAFGEKTSGKASADGHKRRASLGSLSTVNVAGRNDENAGALYGDTGTAARFFYCAKASKADRDAGLEGMPEVRDETHGHGMKMERWPDGSLRERVTEPAARRNTHPTVKPTELCRYLVRLVTPPGGVVLDPFMGSGSTGRGAVLEGFDFIGIEREAEYIEIARRRIAEAQRPHLPQAPEKSQPDLFAA
jgi:hypothetical protein